MECSGGNGGAFYVSKALVDEMGGSDLSQLSNGMGFILGITEAAGAEMPFVDAQHFLSLKAFNITKHGNVDDELC